MTTSTRRISFYLKLDVVKSEQAACDYLDNLPASERRRAQRAAFLAGLALIKNDPAFAYWLAEWPENETASANIHIRSQKLCTPSTEPAGDTNQIKKNIRAIFPE